MWLELGNLHTKLVRYEDEERRWLREYLSFEDVQARFRKWKRGDGRIHQFNLSNDTFPAGFTRMVMEAALEEGFKVEVLDKRVPPATEPDASVDLEWLRGYQREAVDICLKRTRGILWMPTGAGKTEVFAGLTLQVPGRWLFLVHRTGLVHLAADRVEKRTGLTVGRIGEGEWEGFSHDRDVRVVCATFQTVHAAMASKKEEHREAALELLDSAIGVCIDECHTLPADSFWRVAMSTRNAYYRIGLSGTPLARGDKRSVLAIGALGGVIFRLKPDVLIEAGVLAKPKVRMLPLVQESTQPTWAGVYSELVVKSERRNQLIVEAAKRALKPCLVFVKEIHHGKVLDSMLSKAGLSSSFVYGSHSTEWRSSHVKRLIQGGLDVLVCSVVFQEGVDIPSLRSVVVASGGKSDIATLQRVGRGMRVEEGKTEFEVYDVLDRGNRWTEGHARQRMRAFAREGYETIVESPQLTMVKGAASK